MDNKLRKRLWMAMLIAIGFVLSPILRVPGMAPMQHFINVIAAVTTGPWGALAVALGISALRMALMGINGLALTGSVFGAFLAGWLYKKGKRAGYAALGEWIGTGIIGSLLSFPLMRFVYGMGEIALFTYVPSFILGMTIGGQLGLLFIHSMKRMRFFREMMEDTLR